MVTLEELHRKITERLATLESGNRALREVIAGLKEAMKTAGDPQAFNNQMQRHLSEGVHNNLQSIGLASCLKFLSGVSDDVKFRLQDENGENRETIPSSDELKQYSKQLTSDSAREQITREQINRIRVELQNHRDSLVDRYNSMKSFGFDLSKQPEIKTHLEMLYQEKINVIDNVLKVVDQYAVKQGMRVENSSGGETNIPKPPSQK